MATAKKGAKSNKTAHVLNLLTAPGAAKEAPAEPTPEDEGVPQTVIPAEVPETAGRPLAPPVLEVARSNDAQISLQIKDALENELLAETGEDLMAPPSEAEPVQAAEPAPEPVPIPEPAPAPQPAAIGGKLSQEDIERMLAGGIPESEPAPSPKPEPAPAPQPAATGGKLSQEDIERMLAGGIPESEPAPSPKPEPAPAPQPAATGGKLSQEDIERMLAGGIPESEPAPSPKPEPAPAPQPAAPEPQPDPEELQIINVMEYLVELKAPRYISMFGLCTCPRCIADVKALTLTNLQPSYVVVPRSEAHGMLTVYESRFNSTVFAQLTRSCKVVMDNPRHNQKFML